jgi:MFS family permease
MGSINSYPQYREYFGFPVNGGTPSTGIVYAIYTIGNLVGSFAAGPACDTFGKLIRRHFDITHADFFQDVGGVCS